jgi:hypothetical protein
MYDYHRLKPNSLTQRLRKDPDDYTAIMEMEEEENNFINELFNSCSSLEELEKEALWCWNTLTINHELIINVFRRVRKDLILNEKPVKNIELNQIKTRGGELIED